MKAVVMELRGQKAAVLDMQGRVAPGKISRKMVVKASSTDNLFEKSKLSKVMGKKALSKKEIVLY